MDEEFVFSYFSQNKCWLYTQRSFFFFLGGVVFGCVSVLLCVAEGAAVCR